MSELINADRLRRKLTELNRKVIPSAAARAINRVASTVRTRTTRALSKAMGLKAAPIRRRVVIRRKATATQAEAMIGISGRPLNLIEFGARELKKGGVSAKPWGRRQKFPTAFIATMPGGGTIVVHRSKAGRAGKKIRRGRWAGKSPHIEAMHGPGIRNEASTATLRRVRQQTVRERMPIEMNSALRHAVSRLLVKA